jgi:hypothetical protein
MTTNSWLNNLNMTTNSWLNNPNMTTNGDKLKSPYTRPNGPISHFKYETYFYIRLTISIELFFLDIPIIIVLIFHCFRDLFCWQEIRSQQLDRYRYKFCGVKPLIQPIRAKNIYKSSLF